MAALTVLDDCEGLADTSIDFNHAAAGYSMMKTLVENGHRSIVIVTREGGRPRFEDVCSGALRFVEENQSTATAAVRVWRHRGTENLRSDIGRILESPRPPSAMIFTAIGEFLAVHPILAALNIRIPQDLSVIGRGSPLYSNMQNGFQWVNLMEQDFGRIGVEAARLLLRLIDGDAVPHANLLEMPYLKRKSVRRRSTNENKGNSLSQSG